LDEFPWAVQADPTLEGTLQNAWDRALEALPILLILVGSDVTMMERLSEHDRPLFGRAGIMTVRPFNPGECAALMSDAPALSIFDAYLITGGYPRLLSRLARAESAMRFVVDQLTDEASDLAIMAQLSLDAEFPLDSQARQVLSAIGYAELGTMSFSRVTQGLPGTQATVQTAVTRALRLLVDIKRVVAIDVPVGAPKNTRLRRYRVDDPYLRFWFRFVEPQLANMSRGRSDIAIQAFQRGWQTWRGKTMEPVVREAVLRLAPSLDRLRDVESVGGWWNRNNSVEVDLVGASRHGDIRTIGSIKWRERAPFDVRDRHELDAARHAVSGAERAQLIAVSPAGLAHDVDVDMVLTADDLLAAWHA
ncbi:MAG: ATP-binding protein, partial [Jiangellaceae bacterium]